MKPGLQRWLRFNAVGIIGACLQLAILGLLTRAGVHYLLATALSVETAVLHNYVWHRRWTWRDRSDIAGTLWRFHIANGLISLASNLAIMAALLHTTALRPVPANFVAIAVTSLLNYALGNRWVFAPSRP